MPFTFAKLIPNSRAKRRTTGDACAYALLSAKPSLLAGADAGFSAAGAFAAGAGAGAASAFAGAGAAAAGALPATSNTKISEPVDTYPQLLL